LPYKLRKFLHFGYDYSNSVIGKKNKSEYQTSEIQSHDEHIKVTNIKVKFAKNQSQVRLIEQDNDLEMF
jgi:hypothetical protein